MLRAMNVPPLICSRDQSARDQSARDFEAGIKENNIRYRSMGI